MLLQRGLLIRESVIRGSTVFTDSYMLASSGGWRVADAGIKKGGFLKDKEGAKCLGLRPLPVMDVGNPHK